MQRSFIKFLQLILKGKALRSAVRRLCMWISGLKGLILAPTQTKQVKQNTENRGNDMMVLTFYIIRRQKHIIALEPITQEKHA